MNIRPARMIDTPALADILAERQKDSRYYGVDEVDLPYAKKLIGAGIQRHGHTTDGGCFVMVAEDEDGAVMGFVYGMLSRVYHVGHKLAATDVFLIGRKDCPALALTHLFDAYLDWARANPRVVEIGASWSDVIPGSDGFASIYIRKGFRHCGSTYRLDNSVQIEGEAA